MKIVKPEDKVSLFLTPQHMPFKVATARAAFKNLLKNHGRGIDANGEYYGWEQYMSKGVAEYDNQPVMRSGVNSEHNKSVWPIPTVFIVNNDFFTRRGRKFSCKSKGGKPPLREVYKFYDETCCFCHNRIKFKDASLEHIHSRSFGGTNDEENIALACKDCNSKAGNAMPKRDKFGKEVVAKFKIKPKHFTLPEDAEKRPEWMIYCPWEKQNEIRTTQDNTTVQ